MSDVVHVLPNASTVVTLDGSVTLCYDDRWLQHLVETRAQQPVTDLYRRVSVGEAYKRVLAAVGHIRTCAELNVPSDEHELANAICALMTTVETVAQANAKRVDSERYVDELLAARLIVAQLDDETGAELCANVSIAPDFITRVREHVRPYLAGLDTFRYAIEHARTRLARMRSTWLSV